MHYSTSKYYVHNLLVFAKHVGKLFQKPNLFLRFLGVKIFALVKRMLCLVKQLFCSFVSKLGVLRRFILQLIKSFINCLFNFIEIFVNSLIKLGSFSLQGIQIVGRSFVKSLNLIGLFISLRLKQGLKLVENIFNGLLKGVGLVACFPIKISIILLSLAVKLCLTFKKDLKALGKLLQKLNKCLQSIVKKMAILLEQSAKNLGSALRYIAQHLQQALASLYNFILYLLKFVQSFSLYAPLSFCKTFVKLLKQLSVLLKLPVRKLNSIRLQLLLVLNSRLQILSIKLCSLLTKGASYNFTRLALILFLCTGVPVATFSFAYFQEQQKNNHVYYANLIEKNTSIGPSEALNAMKYSRIFTRLMPQGEHPWLLVQAMDEDLLEDNFSDSLYAEKPGGPFAKIKETVLADSLALALLGSDIASLGVQDRLNFNLSKSKLIRKPSYSLIYLENAEPVLRLADRNKAIPTLEAEVFAYRNLPATLDQLELFAQEVLSLDIATAKMKGITAYPGKAPDELKKEYALTMQLGFYNDKFTAQSNVGKGNYGSSFTNYEGEIVFEAQSLKICKVDRLEEASMLAALGSKLANSEISLHNRALKYDHYVQRYAQDYALAPSLIYAIMRIESGFNPSVVSHANALGLMQVVPRTAGGDVHRFLGGKGSMPNPDMLFIPEYNIKYGVTYLHILKAQHFNEVKNHYSRDLCAIAGYNSGPNTVLRVFDRNKDKAIQKINDLTPEELFKKLVESHPSQETRDYVFKVVNTRDTFKY